MSRLKKPLRLPVDKLEPRPPVPPRVFDRLLRFLDNAIPAGPATTSKRKPQNDEPTAANSITPKKRGRPRKEDSSVLAAREALHASGEESINLSKVNTEVLALPGVPRWLPKFISRIRSKLQHHLQQPDSRILDYENVLTKIVAHGISAIRTSLPTTDEDRTEADRKVKDNSPATAVAMLIVVLQRSFGVIPLDVRTVARLAVQELTEGGVVKMTAFGGVLGDAQDLIAEQGDAWREADWNVVDLYLNSETDVPAQQRDDQSRSLEDTDSRKLDLEKGAAAGFDHGSGESAMDDGPIEVPLSRCGPMAQAHTDWFAPERRRDYLQWKDNILKRIAAIEESEA